MSTHALHDGRAGNARQSLALAHALDVEAVELTLVPRAPWCWLAPRQLPASRHAFGDSFAKLAGHSPHLVVGCGRQAALATRVLRQRGSKAVQILDPRIHPRHWDVVVAPEHDDLVGENVITMLGSLHPVDDLWLAQVRREFPEFATWPSPHTLLLVGGPTRHAALGDTEFHSLLQNLSALTRTISGSLSVIASRRTPPAWRDAMDLIPFDLPGLRWRGDHDGANPYAGLLGHADRIVCTPDSMNMLSEAAATLVPVFAWMPQVVSGRPRKFINTLLAGGRIRALDVLTLGAAMTHVAVEPLRETARVAEAIRRRLSRVG